MIVIFNYNYQELYLQLKEPHEPTFAERFAQLLAKQQLTASQWAQQANIDRRYMHKLRCKQMGFSKRFIIKVALSFHLNVRETNQLLASAGYTLSQALPQDIIIAYYINKGIYNIVIINAALYHFKQKLL